MKTNFTSSALFWSLSFHTAVWLALDRCPWKVLCTPCLLPGLLWCCSATCPRFPITYEVTHAPAAQKCNSRGFALWGTPPLTDRGSEPMYKCCPLLPPGRTTRSHMSESSPENARGWSPCLSEKSLPWQQPPASPLAPSLFLYSWPLAPLPDLHALPTSKLPAQKMLSQSLLSGEPRPRHQLLIQFKNCSFRPTIVAPPLITCLLKGALSKHPFSWGLLIPENQHDGGE